MTKRRLIIISAAIGIIVLAFLFTNMMKPKEEVKEEKVTPTPVKFVQTQKVKYADINTKISALGRIKSVNRIELFSEVQGIMDLSNSKFRVASSYKKGETIIKIDDRDAELNLLAQKSVFLNSLTAMLADLKIDYNDEFPKWDKYLQNFVLEKPIADLPKVENDKLKYFLANRNIFTQFYNIKNLEFNFSKFELIAPFDCVVTQSMVDPGALIRPGMKIGEIAQIGDYELELSVSAFDTEFISVGNSVEIEDNVSKKQFSGRIARIGKTIETNTQTVQVFVNIKSNELRDGQYLNAYIGGNMLSDVFELPRKALINNQKVYYAEAGELQITDIQLIKLTDNSAYIRGIKEGTEVITQALPNAKIGMKVEVIKN